MASWVLFVSQIKKTLKKVQLRVFIFGERKSNMESNKVQRPKKNKRKKIERESEHGRILLQQ
jgi:hypothetical protein